MSTLISSTATPVPNRVLEKTSGLSQQLKIPNFFILAAVFMIFTVALAATCPASSVNLPAFTLATRQQILCISTTPYSSPPSDGNGSSGPSPSPVRSTPESPAPIPKVTTVVVQPPPATASNTVVTTSAAAPGPQTSQTVVSNQSIKGATSTFALLCMCLLGSMCYNLGFWKDDDEEKRERKKLQKRNRTETRVGESIFMGEQETGGVVSGLDVKRD